MPGGLCPRACICSYTAAAVPRIEGSSASSVTVLLQALSPVQYPPQAGCVAAVTAEEWYVSWLTVGPRQVQRLVCCYRHDSHVKVLAVRFP